MYFKNISIFFDSIWNYSRMYNKMPNCKPNVFLSVSNSKCRMHDLSWEILKNVLDCKLITTILHFNSKIATKLVIFMFIKSFSMTPNYSILCIKQEMNGFMCEAAIDKTRRRRSARAERVQHSQRVTWWRFDDRKKIHGHLWHKNTLL